MSVTVPGRRDATLHRPFKQTRFGRKTIGSGTTRNQWDPLVAMTFVPAASLSV
jgi:hypothetical protein